MVEIFLLVYGLVTALALILSLINWIGARRFREITDAKPRHIRRLRARVEDIKAMASVHDAWKTLVRNAGYITGRAASLLDREKEDLATSYANIASALLYWAETALLSGGRLTNHEHSLWITDLINRGLEHIRKGELREAGMLYAFRWTHVNNFNCFHPDARRALTLADQLTILETKTGTAPSE